MRSQDIVRTAAVAGRRFSTDLVARLAKASDRAAFEDLSASGLIIPDGASRRERYRFKHALVQDAIYGSLLLEDRQMRYAKVGRKLEALYPERLSEFSATLSRHFGVAGENLIAARYASMAGGKAFDLFALSDADHWYRKAVALFPEAADEADERLRAQAISNHIQISCWDARFTDMIDLADNELKRLEALGDALSKLGSADAGKILAQTIAAVERSGMYGVEVEAILLQHGNSASGVFADETNGRLAEAHDIARTLGWQDLSHRVQGASV
jgi:predicted ATPase